MTIVLLEDDGLQSQPLKEHLESEFGARVILAKSVWQFRDLLQRIASPPDLFILDIMLPWRHRDDPPRQALPAGLDLDDPHKGVRCLEWLAVYPLLANVPAFLYTELERSRELDREISRLPKTVPYLRKEPDFDNLDRLIRELVLSPRRARPATS